MRKKLKATLALLITAFMLLILPLSLCTSAVNVGKFPTEWQSPTNLIIAKDGENEFCLQLSYTVGDDYSIFKDDIENNSDFAKYGLESECYESGTIQADWRIDGGEWHYSPLWDKGEEDRIGADSYLYYRESGPYGNEKNGYISVLRLPMFEDYSSNYEGWKDVFTACGVTLTSNEDGYSQLDLTKHKIEVRIRILSNIIGSDIDTAYGEENSSHIILSPWSDIVSIGAGTGAILEKPTSLPIPTVTNFTVGEAKDAGFTQDGHPIFNFNLTVTPEVEKLSAMATALWHSFYARVEVSVNAGEWTGIICDTGHDTCAITSGKHICYMPELDENGVKEVLGGECRMRVRYEWYSGDGNDLFSEWCEPLSFKSASWKASVWATDELKKADALGIIPEAMKSEDLTRPITRAEFAAVSVKAYEALSGVAAIPAVNNPFTDTNDVEVLKAFNVGITAGKSVTTFDPSALLNREQAATMLTRVFKKVSLSGWTLAADSQFTLPYTKGEPFADDASISTWAKDSVYFMAANKIINGVGDNKFAPQNITTEEKATGYANATREQALIIAVRMVENLKK